MLNISEVGIRASSSVHLILELVFPQSSGEGGCPHVKSCSSRQHQKQQEGNLEPKEVHHATGHSAECQLAQDLQRCEKTVVGGLKGTVGKEEEQENVKLSISSLFTTSKTVTQNTSFKKKQKQQQREEAL